ITQQLAKNLFLSPERTIKRKVQELMLSVWLEQKFTKDEILTLYLNRVYMGSGSYGVDAAAERYFHKSARNLSLSESAIIAGLLKAPSRYSPANNPELAKERAATVIDAMVDAGFLDDTGAEKAKKRPARPQAYYEGPSHGSYYFADWVLDQVPDFIGRVDEDITIITTLDSSLQRTAEESLGRVMDAEGAGLNASQAALLSMTPDGAVRAMVGGRSYLKSQFNRATQAQRQPGSSFKLFVYAAGVEAGFLPNDTMVDRPITIRKWSPSNYDGRYRGTMTLRDAFAESVNSIAVQLSESVGRNRVVDMALRLGITSPIMPTPSLALGANEVNLVELTGAYAHFAHGGRSVWPYGISEIKNADGKTLYKRLDSPFSRILEPHVVATMVDMMRAVIDDGTGGNARIGRAAAGKTGTSQDFRDAWFEGFTADYVTGVWVGNDDSTPMKHVTGGGLPARIWHDYMIKAHENLPARAIISYESDWSDTPRAIPWDYGSESSTSPESLPAPAALEQQPEIPDEGPNPENATMLENLLDSLDDTVDRLDDKVEYTYPTPKKR
ncbi:MAG: PBP1A family penicillin-binding protein, partial [Alphaproteobacteria bacterium]|nr:PBP1A family penicillin-binding protein [Alphaproteobacteria bacterium]